MLKIFRFIFAIIICTVALLLPYRLRIYWFLLVSSVIHFPFKIFGTLALYMLKKLEIENLYEK